MFRGLCPRRHSEVAHLSVNSLLSPPAGAYFFSCAFERGLEREGEGAYLIQRNVSTGATFLQDGLVVTGRYTTFSNNKKMVIILHRELEHKVENVLHKKLDVMRPKTKNNKNYQP